MVLEAGELYCRVPGCGDSVSVIPLDISWTSILTSTSACTGYLICSVSTSRKATQMLLWHVPASGNRRSGVSNKHGVSFLQNR